jgi:hypothetical protein
VPAANSTASALAASSNAATGVLISNGADTLAGYQAVLDSMIDNSTSQNPTPMPTLTTLVSFQRRQRGILGWWSDRRRRGPLRREYNGGRNGEGNLFEIAKAGDSYASTPTTLVGFTGTVGDQIAVRAIPIDREGVSPELQPCLKSFKRTQIAI